MNYTFFINYLDNITFPYNILNKKKLYYEFVMQVFDFDQFKPPKNEEYFVYIYKKTIDKFKNIYNTKYISMRLVDAIIDKLYYVMGINQKTTNIFCDHLEHILMFQLGRHHLSEKELLTSKLWKIYTGFPAGIHTDDLQSDFKKEMVYPWISRALVFNTRISDGFAKKYMNKEDYLKNKKLKTQKHLIDNLEINSLLDSQSQFTINKKTYYRSDFISKRDFVEFYINFMII